MWSQKDILLQVRGWEEAGVELLAIYPCCCLEELGFNLGKRRLDRFCLSYWIFIFLRVKHSKNSIQTVSKYQTQTLETFPLPYLNYRFTHC